MTQTQRAALDAALARAERDGIQVTGQGTRKADGARVFRNWYQQLLTDVV